MNKLSHSVLWIVTVLVTACNIQPKQEPIEEVIDRGLKSFDRTGSINGKRA